jgi:sugar lactone lactonase YvrE
MGLKVIKGDQIQCVLPWQANVGECPVWSPQESRLYWIDILEKRVHRFDPHNKKNETFDLPEIVACLGLRESGGLILALKKNFAFFDSASLEHTNLAGVESEVPNNRFNDGKCDPRGRFWAGTMDSVHWDQPAGNLFRFDSHQKTTLMQSNVVCANGLGWSPDEQTMYFTESFRYAIFSYDFEPETGNIFKRRLFAEIDRSHGEFPDGMTVDSEGFIWSNIVGPGQIHRFDKDGKIERILQLPVPRATSCTFGGDDLKTLYVTSSRETLTSNQLQEFPLSGSLFAIPMGIKGLPSTPYKG